MTAISNITNPDEAGGRRLHAALLRRALDDLVTLTGGDNIPLGHIANERLTLPKRREMYAALTGWFFLPCDESDAADSELQGATLEQTCVALNLDIDRVRGKAGRIVNQGFRVQTRRRRLSTAVRAAILGGLSRGRKTRELTDQFNINQATVRKIRIAARREAAEVAA